VDPISVSATIAGIVGELQNVREKRFYVGKKLTKIQLLINKKPHFQYK